MIKLTKYLSRNLKKHSSKNNKNYILDTNNNKLITSEVIDESSYQHFKSLLSYSQNLCKGKTSKGKHYKVHIATHKNFETLKKHNHYRIIYVHNNYEIIAYISVKLYKRDGGFMFIHKVCSTGRGEGTRLMNIILDDAKKNYQSLGITYLSLTTHNLDLVNYYKQFIPTRTEIIDNPGSKAKTKKKVAYIIWQLSSKMPWFDYN